MQLMQILTASSSTRNRMGCTSQMTAQISLQDASTRSTKQTSHAPVVQPSFVSSCCACLQLKKKCRRQIHLMMLKLVAPPCVVFSCCAWLQLEKKCRRQRQLMTASAAARSTRSTTRRRRGSAAAGGSPTPPLLHPHKTAGTSLACPMKGEPYATRALQYAVGL